MKLLWSPKIKSYTWCWREGRRTWCWRGGRRSPQTRSSPNSWPALAMGGKDYFQQWHDMIFTSVKFDNIQFDEIEWEVHLSTIPLTAANCKAHGRVQSVTLASLLATPPSTLIKRVLYLDKDFTCNRVCKHQEPENKLHCWKYFTSVKSYTTHLESKISARGKS